jgi:hypothetical protein
MMAALRALLLLGRRSDGTMAIETALVAPILATLALGAFDASNMLSRQQQLQSGANEASEIILAAAGGSGIASNELEIILENSLNLSADQLQIAPRYRCDDSTTLATTPPGPPGCAASKPIYQYVQLTLTETYTPMWTSFGIGSPMNYNVVRLVQIS